MNIIVEIHKPSPLTRVFLPVSEDAQWLCEYAKCNEISSRQLHLLRSKGFHIEILTSVAK